MNLHFIYLKFLVLLNTLKFEDEFLKNKDIQVK